MEPFPSPTTDQRTAWRRVPRTWASKRCVSPIRSRASRGRTSMATGCRRSVATALLEGSATLVARTTIVAGVSCCSGVVYNPLSLMAPWAGPPSTLQVTRGSSAPSTAACSRQASPSSNAEPLRLHAHVDRRDEHPRLTRGGAVRLGLNEGDGGRLGLRRGRVEPMIIDGAAAADDAPAHDRVSRGAASAK